MHATSLQKGDHDLVRRTVDKVREIARVVSECAEISGVACDTNDFKTFIRVLRSLRVDAETEPRFELQIPTPRGDNFLSSLDPFVLAEGLREINVELSVAVFDIENVN